MSWPPTTRSELDALIASGEAQLTPAQHDLWQEVRTSPERWRLSPEGDAGGGFWTVGLRGDQVIWFNDIEEGFELSRFVEHGAIGEYRCDQLELSHVMQQLVES